MTKVTFKLPRHIAAEASEGIVLGDFNNWNIESGIPLQVSTDGSLQATVDLEPGQSYQYRYLLSGGRWENDDTAQYYVSAQGMHVENCVVVVEQATPPVETQAPVKKSESKKSPASTRKSPVLKTDILADDLLRIEGIGKQVSGLLAKNSISTFAALSKASIKKLKDILESGAVKFKTLDPSSWPKQAKLASVENWEELKTLQAGLKAGKKKTS